MRLGRLLPAILLPGLLLLPACASHYQSPAFVQQTFDHRAVAVLPFEMIFTGKAPKNLTGDDILRIEADESLAFQSALYNRLLNRSQPDRKHPIYVDIQPVEMTNQILADAGYDLFEIHQIDSSTLAGALGVDAVVRTRVEKSRYLSDLASFGIEVGVAVLLEAINDNSDIVLPWLFAKTHDIWAESVVEGYDGVLLSQVSVRRSTDWTRPANDIIYGITRRLARKFPYQGVA